MVGFFNLLSVEEYKHAPNTKGYRELAQGWSLEKIADYLGNSDYPVEKVRPFVGEYLWSMFFAYRQVMGRITYRLSLSLEDANNAEWHKDNNIRQILEAVLNENELAEFESTRLGKISWLEQRLESKILAASQKIISGEELGVEALRQAELILQRVDKAKLTDRREFPGEP